MIHPFLLGLCFLIAVFLLLSVDFSSAQMQGRIVGGKPSAPGAWPFMAAIMRRNETVPPRHFCGGVIWNEDTILTAAHCLQGRRQNGAPPKPLPAKFLSVLLGQTDISSPVPEYTFQASELLIHPQYNTTNHYNDVGLIKLARAIDFTGEHPKAGCICDPLPVSSLNGSACLALGWGLTEPEGHNSSPQLMQIELALLSNDVCSSNNPIPWLGFNSSTNVCARHLGGGGNIHKGDSGGPLLCQLPAEANKYSLVGLTSFSSLFGFDNETPGYYAKVETYLQWIGQASGE